VKGWNSITINDILMGEVWLCSGQSNMAFSAQWVYNFANDVKEGRSKATFDVDKELAFIERELAAADHPALRFFTVGSVTADPPWGGTPADVWTPAPLMQGDRVLGEFLKIRDKETWGPHAPGVLYNAMIHPLIPFRIAGVIWNQGEENVGANRGDELYARLFATMVRGWRSAWGYDFPILYVQIPPYRYDAGNPAAFRAAQLRDQQRRALDLIPDSEMIVTSDVGNIEDIHPMDKLSVGERLATWALNRVYNVSDEIPCGPLYEGMSVEGGAIRVSFIFADGLQALDGKPLSDFQIAGEDRVFHPATAIIDGETVLVSSPEVKQPLAVRFAWTDIATPNLCGGSGLPASSFRSDDWPLQ
jgi:sialate O-acetylesterase